MRSNLTDRCDYSGFIDYVVSALSAVEKLGAENVNGFLVVWCIGLMIHVDGEALPQIEDKLRAIPSAFRYLKDSRISHCEDLGMSVGTFGTVAVANLWGKDEENIFGFARELCPHRGQLVAHDVVLAVTPLTPVA